MVRNVPLRKSFFFFKALLHWIVLQISHLVAITFGATLLGKMLAAEVRDMLDDFRMKAGWRSAMYNFTQKRRNTRLYFCSFFPVSLCVLSFSRPVFLYFFVFPSVFMSILYIFVRWALKKKGLSWREFRSFVSSFRSPTSIPTSSSYKWENGNCLLFGIGCMTHETTMGKTVRGYNTITVVLSLSLK